MLLLCGLDLEHQQSVQAHSHLKGHPNKYTWRQGKSTTNRDCCEVAEWRFCEESLCHGSLHMRGIAGRMLQLHSVATPETLSARA